MELIPAEILSSYNLLGEENIKQIGSGFINRTFLVSEQKSERKFILQEINVAVFKEPEIIAHNIQLVSNYLEKNHPDYLFPASLPSIQNKLLTEYEGSYWRLMPYVENTWAHETLSNPDQAYQAAAQFGKLTRLLKDFPIKTLGFPIKDFHNLDLRIQQFKKALANAPLSLKNQAQSAIKDAEYFQYISKYYNSYLKRPDFPDRVIHHDTKISNVLLNRHTDEGVCVIDLDTLMPGKFISDLGDMMRTYLCAFSENEQDLSKINIRLPYFEATVKGYLSEMGPIMTATEKELILFSGKYIIYMQALRFLIDYLNGNIYYRVDYPEQNLSRANNQFALLKDIYAQETILQDMVNNILKAQKLGHKKGLFN